MSNDLVEVEPLIAAKPDLTKTVRLRQISSLDGSPLFVSLDEKEQALKAKAPAIHIPAYPVAKPYRSNSLKRLYSRARYFYALMRQKMSGKDYPLIVVLVVNNKCNWNCTYCFGDYPNRKETDYTTDEIKFLVDELYDMGVRYINMHGGETFLRPDLGDLCNYIKNKGMYLCVITNGSILQKKIEEVRNVDNLTISLDGAREGNDVNRGTGTFQKTVDAIALAVKEKIPLRVQATLTKHTMHDIGYLSQLAKDMNFSLMFSILFKPLKKAQDSQMSNDDIRFTVSEIKKYKNLGFPIFTTEKCLQATYEWPYDFNDMHHITAKQIPESYKKHHIPCYYSRTKFTIEADGYVYPCFLTTDGSFKPKNWREVGLKEAIDHVAKKNTCKACPAMTQNDHNLLLGLDFKQVAYLVKHQVRESFGLTK